MNKILTLDFEKLFYIMSIITALGALFNFLYKNFIKKFFLKIKEKYLYIEGSLTKIDTISKEFLPNHGSSMKDAITKMQLELMKNTEITEKIATRQKWLFDTGEIPIFESDNEGRCVWVNLAYLNLVKRETSFILGNGWKNIIAEEDRERVYKNWQSCINDGRDYEDTYSIIDGNGKKIKVFTGACKTGKYGFVGAIKVLKEESNIDD